MISYGMRQLQDNGDTMPTKKRASSEICYTKKAAWFFAAMAVLEIGLPSLTLPDEPEAATMRVRTMANFAEAMAHWLEQFSAAMVKHQASPCYQRALEYSKKKEDRPQEDRGEKPKKANPFRCA